MFSRAFKWRVFISMGLTLAFLVMLCSGIVLFISPPGRVANWSDWKLLGLTKSGWQNQHTIFGFAFIILSIFHLFVINWKAFLSYIKTKASRGLNSPAELSAALLLFVVMIVGTLWYLPPFAEIVEFGQRWSRSWEDKTGRPPVPHAETLTLAELGRLPQVSSPPEEIVKKLESVGVKVHNSRQTLQEIASQNTMKVQELYRIIVPEHSGVLAEQGGWGEKTLGEVAERAGVAPLALQQALRQQGIEASTDERLREIATRHDMKPSELVRKINNMVEKR